MKRKMRYILTETNFRDLVAGRVAQLPTIRLMGSEEPMDVELVLSDIGFPAMESAMRAAVDEYLRRQDQAN